MRVFIILGQVESFFFYSIYWKRSIEKINKSKNNILPYNYLISFFGIFRKQINNHFRRVIIFPSTSLQTRLLIDRWIGKKLDIKKKEGKKIR